MKNTLALACVTIALVSAGWAQGPAAAPVFQPQRGISTIQDNAASFTLRRKINFVTPNGVCVDNASNGSTDCNLGPVDFFADGNVTTSLGTLINSLIGASTFGGRIQDNIVGETWSSNPFPDNGFFKVTLKSGNGSGPAVRTSVPIGLTGGNWLKGNGRKGSASTSEWIGTRISPSASFPDSITPPAPAVSGFTCTGSSGSFTAGSYLVTTAFVDNLQTYSGTSTVVPGQTTAGTEAIVTCPASGTINIPAHTISTGAFPTTNGFQVFWAKTVNATTTTSTTGASCAATPASCNVPISVASFTDASWARGMAVGMDVVIDVGASQEKQTVVAIDDVNNKIVLKGPLGFAHTNPYPIAPSNSETLQNTTSAGATNAALTCTGTNAANNTYGAMNACTLSSGSGVSVTATLTSGAQNSGAPIPLYNYTAPIVFGGSSGLMGGAEFDAGLKGVQVSCMRPNNSTVTNGMGFVDLNIQEHGVLENDFIRDCADGWYFFGNQTQNSSVVMVEVNDGCATNKTVSGCPVAGSITNKNARMAIQNTVPGPLAMERISSSSASCLNGGCNVTQFPGAVLVVDKSSTVILGAHGEGALDVVKAQNQGSVLLENNSGGSSSSASTLNTVHIASDARTSTIHNQIANGGITAVQDDIFKGPSNITATGSISGGATTITVSSTTGLVCDQELLLDTVASGVQEYVRIANYTASGTTLPALSQCISGSTVTLGSGTVNAHLTAIPVRPLNTVVNEGTFTPTGWYMVSNSCASCVNSNRDRFTSYNGVPSILAGQNQFASAVATDVPVQIGAGPSVTQTGDLLDLYSDNFITLVASIDAAGALHLPVGAAGTPSQTFGDATTGYFRPASNTIGVSISGTESYRWTSTGLKNTSGLCLQWTSGIITASSDVSLCRAGVNIFEIGDGAANANGYLKQGGARRVTADFTTAANTSLQAITGLSWSIPSTVVTAYNFTCDLLYSQATALAAVAFGVQAVTNAPTNLTASGFMFTVATNATAPTPGNVSFASTTATNIVSATPGVIGTTYNVHLAGTLVEPVSTANTFQIMVSTATSGDAVTVKLGSACSFWPTNN